MKLTLRMEKPVLKIMSLISSNLCTASGLMMARVLSTNILGISATGVSSCPDILFYLWRLSRKTKITFQYLYLQLLRNHFRFAIIASKMFGFINFLFSQNIIIVIIARLDTIILTNNCYGIHLKCRNMSKLCIYFQ